MKNINKIFWMFIVVLFVSCETTDLEKLNDPTQPGPENLDPDFTLNSIEVNFSDFFTELTEPTAEAVRLEYMFDRYEVNFNSSNTNLQNVWLNAYAVVFEDVKALLPVAAENDLYIHSGISRTLKAYIMLTLVDLFGDIPYSEANLGNENLFPGLDSGADVYYAALDELDLAISDFNKVSDATPEPPTELFYDGDPEAWVTLINTLKLKAYLNLRLTDASTAQSEISSLINSGNIITDSSGDFVWQFSTANNASKHQYYIEEYLAASTSDYVPNYLVWTMAVEKGIDDPRLRYYFYRQVDEFPTDPGTLNNEIDCWNDPRPDSYAPIDAISPVPLPFCSLFGRGDGYWGRDHAENDGIPPDNTKRTTFGIYPVGGKFDDGEAEEITDSDGLQGEGIWPIMMNSFVYFMRAEAALYLTTPDDPRDMLEQGIRSSISTVMNFLPNPEDFDNIPSEDDINDYVDFVLAQYDNAGGDDARMDVIGKEYYIALFGNGIEGYNLYRRTGAPENLQPTLLGTGEFPRSFFYPNNSVNSNPNITNQGRSFTDQVFWDNNPAGFIY